MIQDWFRRTVKWDILSTADEPSNSNHPYRAVFREVLILDGVVNKAMESVRIFIMEHTESNDFYTLPTLDVRWYIA